MTALIAVMLAPLAAALSAWQLQRSLGPAWQRYRDTYIQDARHGLREVFLFLDPTQLWGMAMICAGLTLGVILAAGGHPAMALAAAAFAWRLPAISLRRLRQRRLERLQAQLPAGLLSLASALRAGASLPAALRQLADLAQPPLAQEIGLMLREQRLGVSFDDALHRLECRVDLPSVRLMTAAFRVAGSAGGNLAQTLEGIAQALRGQLLAEGRLKALTAQGRMQAWVLSALPLVLAVVLYLLRPEQMARLWQTEAGWILIALVMALQVLGWFLIRRILAPLP
ncbi:type II secretion system F family protein [Bordetella avium]|uniref:type II secretion system F family protein n=1 Tax=Bordetella avium TaxID=521 RepID=UPI000E0CA428|nr:type II secretion system F family protein [Bordetella avium]RIQ11968.1 pilus assembly protein [Bordetella avium]RIQ37068.1 pilus assembly protein [Bordetella avium]RIQ39395.1 pilus assembly protein [Bordetella avium]RIQ40839.1 pilus assembly protein [Bordetella avium]RIQ47321.1 pilus assembly protein [Bordetella avium]